MLDLEDRRFYGDDYQPVRDKQRLLTQQDRIFELMQDGKWRTLAMIAAATGDHEASISAQLRQIAAPVGTRGGRGHTKNRRYIGNGLYEYQIIVEE